jgi:hypothetical protein
VTSRDAVNRPDPLRRVVGLVHGCRAASPIYHDGFAYWTEALECGHQVPCPSANWGRLTRRERRRCERCGHVVRQAALAQVAGELGPRLVK